MNEENPRSDMPSPETLFLSGCTPEPLMGYLKALGVFRLVSEQADPNCRAACHPVREEAAKYNMNPT